MHYSTLFILFPPVISILCKKMNAFTNCYKFRSCNAYICNTFLPTWDEIYNFSYSKRIAGNM